MKFSDLYACSKCGLVYAALINGGRCTTPVIGAFGRTDACYGILRPINYKPPTKDPKQRDIEDEIRLAECKHMWNTTSEPVRCERCGIVNSIDAQARAAAFKALDAACRSER